MFEVISLLGNKAEVRTCNSTSGVSCFKVYEQASIVYMYASPRLNQLNIHYELIRGAMSEVDFTSTRIYIMNFQFNIYSRIT